MFNYAVIHYGEIAIKGGNRPWFERMLIDNIRDKLKDLKYKELKKISGRFILELEKNSDLNEIEKRLKEVFGLSYFTFAISAKQEINSMKKAIEELIEDDDSKTVRVLTKRSNKQFQIKSEDVNKELGSYLIEKYNKTIDLVDAELSIWIEIVEKYCFVYKKKIPCLGGLPVGVSGKVLSLISGGIDSPVASWMMMKRGCNVKYVHFFNDAINSRQSLEKIKDLVSILDKYGRNSKLYIIPFKEIQMEIIKKVPGKYRMIIYKRFMMRIAEKIARRDECKALVTGENLGQVASQTIPNLSVIEDPCKILVLRPLLGMDKQEIIDLGIKIGTYDTSIRPYEDCCSYMIDRHPETSGSLEIVGKFEDKIDVDKLVEEAIKNKVIFKKNGQP